MLNLQDQVRFEAVVLPNLDAAFNLARWLLRAPTPRTPRKKRAPGVSFLRCFSRRRCACLAVAIRAEHTGDPTFQGSTSPAVTVTINEG